MANMSYCRFTNTHNDLEDCLDSIRDNKSTSVSETWAGKCMFKDFLNFCRQYSIIDSYDPEMVDALFNGLREKEDADDE